jgi:Flp pilus assembly pilin Flp
MAGRGLNPSGRARGRRRSGFFSIEYSALVAIVAAALVGMSVYILRAVCGKWRETADAIGDGRQYEFGKTKINGVIQ